MPAAEHMPRGVVNPEKSGLSSLRAWRVETRKIARGFDSVKLLMLVLSLSCYL